MSVIRVLLVEDSEIDAHLILRALAKEGDTIEHVRVEDAPSLKSALARSGFDIVISDWMIPGFSGLGALEIVKASGVTIPFILASGTIGEEMAVDAVRAGANDYVLKDRLTRLLPAVHRELRRSEEDRARLRAETEIHLKESLLRASEERYRRIVETTTEGVWTLDADARTTFMNGAMAAILGCDRDAVVGTSLFDFIPESERDRARESLKDRADGIGEHAEVEFLRTDGGTVWCLMSATSSFDAAGNYCGALAMVSDMTERRSVELALRKTEEQLRQAQKMESIGRLAGGIAHDFNNVLSVILSYGSMILKDLREGDPLRADIEEINSAGHRAVGLTRQLLAFSRQQVLQPKTLDLNEIVASTEKMLRRIIGEDIDLTTIAGTEIGAVHADPGQIEQVLMNLAVNARDAMLDGGTLVVTTALEDVTEARASSLPGLKRGPYVTLAVTDSGCGMDAATMLRIFEPFFTTKEKDKGTGLGLSTVFGIVHQSGGVIEVASEVGKGTTFTIYLPRVAAIVEAKTIAMRAASTRGSETILLVEDETAVRLVLRSVLRREGYQVLDAGNGGEALLICERHAGRIDIVLSDVVMPRMGGVELLARLAKVRPEMRQILMSGYNDDEMLRRGIESSTIAFLQKPVSPEHLGAKVREVLDAPALPVLLA